MSDDQTIYGLSDADLERAAEAAAMQLYSRGAFPLSTSDMANIWRIQGRASVRAALPVLGPALREAMVREMIADAEDGVWALIQPYGFRCDVTDEMVAWIRAFLPAAEEGATR